jgi:hypothetical protein
MDGVQRAQSMAIRRSNGGVDDRVVDRDLLDRFPERVESTPCPRRCAP